MALREYKPTSPGRRGMTVSTFEEITKKKPEKALLVTLKKRGGRNVTGSITVRHRGGGSKRRLRLIDFKRNKFDVPAEVVAIEYDPNRSSRIALVQYADGEKRYITAPLGLKVGDVIVSAQDTKDIEVKVGNALPLYRIPVGAIVHNIELHPGKGGQLVRSAGSVARVMGKDEKYVLVRMPSGELRRILGVCMATVGQVGNIEHQNITVGKAGRNRWMGWRPTVRGSAMSPRAHPHGGGEGRTSRGMNPKTPWGKLAYGCKTRGKKSSDKMIVERRK